MAMHRHLRVAIACLLLAGVPVLAADNFIVSTSGKAGGGLSTEELKARRSGPTRRRSWSWSRAADLVMWR
jgi:hypothetical protein